MRKTNGAVFMVMLLAMLFCLSVPVVRAENDYFNPEFDQLCRSNNPVLKQKYPDKTVWTQMSFGVFGGVYGSDFCLVTLVEPETDIAPIFVTTALSGEFMEELEPVRIPPLPDNLAVEYCEIDLISADDFNGDDRPDFVIRIECNGVNGFMDPINGVYLSHQTDSLTWVQAPELNDRTYGMNSYGQVYKAIKAGLAAPSAKAPHPPSSKAPHPPLTKAPHPPSTKPPVSKAQPTPAGPVDRRFLPTVIDAAMDWNRQIAIFFQANAFFVYDKQKDRVVRGYPKSINSKDWPGLWTNGFDAAVNWRNGKVYFFKGGSYLRYDVRKGRMDQGYPKRINQDTWPGLWPGGVDAAVNWGNGKAYFFKGNMYIRYDITTDRADPGYPKPINHKSWPGLTFTNGIDAAINYGNGKAYFFRGSDYIRYDIRTDKADPGYPKPINQKNWPGITY